MSMRLHVYPLDAVRFFAAFCVLAFHLGFYAWAAPHSTVGTMYHDAGDFTPLAPFTWFGWVGVEIFFVISGFVIANSANSSSPIRFAKSRALRLYPAVWFCALLTFAAWIVFAGEPWTELLSRLARSASLWVTGPWIDAVYWTLAVEMMFYLLIFVVLLWRRFALLPWVALALVLAPGAFLIAGAAGGDALTATPVWRALSAMGDLLLLRHGAFFAVGMLMWLSSLRGLRRSELATLAAGVIVCCFEIYLRAQGMNRGETETHMVMSPAIPMAVWLVMLGLMFMFARAPQKFEPRSKTVQALLQHVGKMTYPLYLTHAVVGSGLMRFLIGNGVNAWMALAIATVAMLAMASFVAQFVEPAIRRVLRVTLEHIETAMRRTPVLAFLFVPGGAVAGKAVS
jgi:peptidoglycan/LPS O-acetylase OafA/YrhL